VKTRFRQVPLEAEVRHPMGGPQQFECGAHRVSAPAPDTRNTTARIVQQRLDDLPIRTVSLLLEAEAGLTHQQWAWRHTRWHALRTDAL